mgnify:CR=1 FL=1
MSLKKWFFKNGIGSIGHSAKTTCNVYETALTIPFFKDIPFEYLIRVKETAWLQMGIYRKISNRQMLEYSEGCLALLAYEIAYVESIALQDADFENHNIAIESIYEIVQSKYPRVIKLSLKEFKEKANNFSVYYFTTKYY